ncbi:MAG: YccF domain-containing protein [Caldilineales bacterium]|nr:YccF domain-containing protein [Caldilineales bacterium]
MSCLGNILWLVFGGFLASLGYFIGGLVWCITIIGIPFGIQSIRIGAANLTPFGKEVVSTPQANSTLYLILDLIWLVFFGWEIALIHLISAALLFITIIGIPFAKQHWKLIPVALLPFGRELRDVSHVSHTPGLTVT